MAYSAEEEQELNELKSWIKENYKSMIVIFVLVFGGVFGWRYWQDYQVAKMQQSSVEYNQLIHSKNKNNQIEQFGIQHSGTGYAVFAYLDGAKSAVLEQDFKKAEKLLLLALKDPAVTNNEILLSITALRLASVQFQLQNFDGAANSLNIVKGEVWESGKNLLLGEILLAKSDKEGAKAVFEKVLKSGSQAEIQSAQVRLNNL